MPDERGGSPEAPRACVGMSSAGRAVLKPLSLSCCLPVPCPTAQGQSAPEGLDLVRCVATARVVMPKTVVRLSAGRLDLSRADQVGGGAAQLLWDDYRMQTALRLGGERHGLALEQRPQRR